MSHDHATHAGHVHTDHHHAGHDHASHGQAPAGHHEHRHARPPVAVSAGTGNIGRSLLAMSAGQRLLLVLPLLALLWAGVAWALYA